MKKIIIVVDMQNDFIDGSLGSERATNIVLPNIEKKLSEETLNDDVTILFTRDTHGIDYLDTFEGKRLPVEHCIEGTHGWEIADCLKPYAVPCDIINKETFGSLRCRNEEGNRTLTTAIFDVTNGGEDDFELELCGLCTDICVISNALICRAMFPDRKITVDSSCCGGTSDAAHEAALAVMRSCQIDVV